MPSSPLLLSHTGALPGVGAPFPQALRHPLFSEHVPLISCPSVKNHPHLLVQACTTTQQERVRTRGQQHRVKKGLCFKRRILGLRLTRPLFLCLQSGPHIPCPFLPPKAVKGRKVCGDMQVCRAFEKEGYSGLTINP